MVYYPEYVNVGTDALTALGDGQTINVKWFQAVPADGYKIAYHIYYSTEKKNVFYDGVKYISIDNSLEANLIGLTPGQQYFVAVRPVEYNPLTTNLSILPIAYDNLRVYPTSMLRSNISATDLTIPFLDVAGFPSAGIIKVGIELIQYLSVDTVNNNLIVPGGGIGALPARILLQDGYLYSSSISNIGHGTLDNLVLVSPSAITETWTIRCSSVQRDMLGHTIANTAKFIATGSISGQKYDGYGNPFVWTAGGSIVSNGVLSFSISETGPIFFEGDTFIVKTASSVAGTNSGRGFANTSARIHNVDGYDGYFTWDPTVSYFILTESKMFDRIYSCQPRFEYANYSYTTIDGYRQVTKDILSTDLSASEETNLTFPTYDYAGYHRTDPVQLLNGTCVGSYIGGEMGCIDQYGNVQILRGMSLQDQNNQRQELLLTVTGRPAVLIKRNNTGIICSCYLASGENPDDRCPKCHGTKFVIGYEQFFYPRRSDGRIMVRVSPADESTKVYEAGLESEFTVDIWTLASPIIKNRDILVLFDQDNNEEFRYEVLSVTRNNTITGLMGGQKMRAQRIRKTDPAYQIRVFDDTSMFPSKLNTNIGFAPGIPPHTHEIVINEKIVSISQINQTTAVSQGHNHQIVNGIVQTVLGHTHKIIIP